MMIRKRIKIRRKMAKTGAKRMKEREVTTKRKGERKLVKGTTKNQKLKRKSNSN